MDHTVAGLVEAHPPSGLLGDCARPDRAPLTDRGNAAANGSCERFVARLDHLLSSRRPGRHLHAGALSHLCHLSLNLLGIDGAPRPGGRLVKRLASALLGLQAESTERVTQAGLLLGAQALRATHGLLDRLLLLLAESRGGPEGPTGQRAGRDQAQEPDELPLAEPALPEERGPSAGEDPAT